MTTLIADSGSTGTDWAIVPANGRPMIVPTDGINPFYQDADGIARMLRETFAMVKPDRIFFYGAGCTESRAATVADALRMTFGQCAVEIESDMLGAARALCGHSAGVACILGTGSNSCLFDGERIVASVSPLGYVLGDEGSGAHIGRRIVADVLKKQLPFEVRNLFWSETELTPSDIIDRVYRQPYPNRFLASFASFASSHIDVEALAAIVGECFDSFVERNLMQYDGIGTATVGFVGSVARHFEQQLRQSMRRHGLTVGAIVDKPIMRLVEYHCKGAHSI